MIRNDPRTLLVLRTILGLTKDEFAHCTVLVAEQLQLERLSAGKVDSMEKRGTTATDEQARVVAATLAQVVEGSLFGDPRGDLRRKQDKLDTEHGWQSLQHLAGGGVPYADFLHQRHYDDAFRQVLDATSSRRGNLVEDAVEQLFLDNGIPFIRTGSTIKATSPTRFEIRVAPAPDFVVFGSSETLRAMLECKLVNDGDTVRDKALRFERLRAEAVRLGGIPLLAVLAGLGWARVTTPSAPSSATPTDGSSPLPRCPRCATSHRSDPARTPDVRRSICYRNMTTSDRGRWLAGKPGAVQGARNYSSGSSELAVREP